MFAWALSDCCLFQHLRIRQTACDQLIHALHISPSGPLSCDTPLRNNLVSNGPFTAVGLLARR